MKKIILTDEVANALQSLYNLAAAAALPGWQVIVKSIVDEEDKSEEKIS